MNSLVYFYSKFTEEFLLLSAAGVFTLLSIYCYHWVVQKRRLGIARSQIPSSVVKSYLSQLINEAEFVRKQLFGMTDGNTYVPTAGFSGEHAHLSSLSPSGNQSISPDLLARVNALEHQLKEKEGLVVNINIEKTKLLEEIEKMKSSPKAAPVNTAAQDQLTQKIKNLEARLEEYALFEEDLANLKQLQQENTQLKKKLGGMDSGSPAITKEAPVERKTLSAVPDIEPEVPTVAPVAKAPSHALDQDAIDALLNGTSATPPEVASPPPAVEALAAGGALDQDAIDALLNGIESTPAPAPTPIEEFPELEIESPSDQFENLVDSVEDSLEVPPPVVAAAPAPAPVQEAAPKPAPAPAPVPKASVVAAPSPAAESPLANKTDEELLKEFESLLNS